MTLISFFVLVVLSVVTFLAAQLRKANRTIWILREEVNPLAISVRVRKAERELLRSLIADAIRTHAGGEGVPKPTSIDEFMRNYFSGQPGCGEVIFEAPMVYVEKNPQAAIEWYEANITSLSNGHKELLLRNN